MVSSNDFVQERVEFANTFITLSKDAKAFITDPTMDRFVYMIDRKDSVPVMVHKCKFFDLTVEDWKLFTEHYFECLQEMAQQEKGKIKLEKLKDLDGGRILWHQKLEPGIPFVSNRHLFPQTYFPEVSEGHAFMVSSRNSEAFNQEYKTRVGKDVVAELEVNFWHFRPTADGKGSDVVQVAAMNPGGSIPGPVVNMMSKKMNEALLSFAKMVRAKKN